MVLRAGVTFRSESLAAMLRLPSSVIPRGTEIPVAALAGMRNAQSMLNSRVLRWTVPSVPRPVPAAATPKPVPPVKPRDYIAELRAALKPHLHRGLDVALDLVDQQAVLAAQTAYAHRSGQASGARSVSGFRSCLVEAST